MNERDAACILCLHDAALPLSLGEVHRATSAARAADLLHRLRPDVVALDCSSAWGAALLRSVAEVARPAIVAVGPPPGVHADLVDEWLSGRESPEEMQTRIGLARTRATNRRTAARLAYVDSLTDLPNRRALLRALGRETARVRRRGGEVALVLIDLDHFKDVNEREGHPAGDRLLREVGHQLAGATRREELCARIGGDEFAMVVAGGLAHAEVAARRVRAALAAIGVEATVVACELGRGERLSDLYRRADEQLRAAKRARGPRQPPKRSAA